MCVICQEPAATGINNSDCILRNSTQYNLHLHVTGWTIICMEMCVHNGMHWPVSSCCCHGRWPCSGRMISHSLMCLYNICQSESGACCVCKIQEDSMAHSQTESLTFQYQAGDRTGQDMAMPIIKYCPILQLSCKCV